MFCKECKKKPFCVKICKKVRKFIPKMTDGRIKDENGMVVELSVDPHIIDVVQFNRGRGVRKKPIHYNDNWETIS